MNDCRSDASDRGPPFVPWSDRQVPCAAPEDTLRLIHDRLRRRRSVRAFSARSVSRETIEWIVRCATTAPSGANRQPWRFVAVRDPQLKRRIRLAAEDVERSFYEKRASDRWLADLEPLGTGAGKRFLEEAPWILAVFKLVRGDDGGPVYYPDESVGIAVGLLISALHEAGLATLPYTPSPMGFLGAILGRPPNERPFLVLPIGYPPEDSLVPEAAARRRPLDEVLVIHD